MTKKVKTTTVKKAVKNVKTKQVKAVNSATNNRVTLTYKQALAIQTLLNKAGKVSKVLDNKLNAFSL